MSITSTRPRAPCPGGSTGRAWRGGTSRWRPRARRRRRPRRSRRRRRRGRRRRRPARAAALIASMTPPAGSRGAPVVPVPSSASTIPAAPSSRAASKASGGAPGRRAKLLRGVAAQVLGRPDGQDVDVAPRLPQQPRGDQAVAAVVALPADDDDPARPARAARRRAASPSPARSIRSSDGTPRSSIAQRSVARICSASGSGSSQSVSVTQHRHGRRHPVRVRERDLDRPAELGRPARRRAPVSRTDGGSSPPPSDLDVVPAPLAQLERLRDRLLGAEARGQVHAPGRARVAAYARSASVNSRSARVGRRASARSRRRSDGRRLADPGSGAGRPIPASPRVARTHTSRRATDCCGACRCGPPRGGSPTALPSRGTCRR